MTLDSRLRDCATTTQEILDNIRAVKGEEFHKLLIFFSHTKSLGALFQVVAGPGGMGEKESDILAHILFQMCNEFADELDLEITPSVLAEITSTCDRIFDRVKGAVA